MPRFLQGVAMVDQRLRTEFSMRAHNMSEIFRAHYVNFRIGGAVQYAIDLSAPEGPSTGGGAHAVQHLRLIPAAGVTAQTPILPLGTVAQTTLTAQLRTYDHVGQTLANRVRGAQLAFAREPYDGLMGEIRAFLTGMGFNVTVEVPRMLSGPVARPTAAATGATSPWLWVVAVLALAVAAGVTLVFVRH
jgi:hypothetical protein